MSRGAFWTPEQITKLAECLEQCADLPDTARAVGRTEQSCIERLKNMRRPLPANWRKRPLRSGFDFKAVQPRGANAGVRARELAQRSVPTVRRFSWEGEQ